MGNTWSVDERKQEFEEYLTSIKNLGMIIHQIIVVLDNKLDTKSIESLDVLYEEFVNKYNGLKHPQYIIDSYNSPTFFNPIQLALNKLFIHPDYDDYEVQLDAYVQKLVGLQTFLLGHAKVQQIEQ